MNRWRRRVEKRIIWFVVSLMIPIFSPAHAFTLYPEYNTDRPGCDYKNFSIPNPNNIPYTPNFSVCMDACGLDTSCQAWNFDTRSSGKGVCYLKNCTPNPTTADGTVGGIKLSATMSGSESGIDRPGCDFQSIPLAEMTQELCEAACSGNSSCLAWNLDPRSGTPTCYLKKCVPIQHTPPLASLAA
jgi:hypothetical protein